MNNKAEYPDLTGYVLFDTLKHRDMIPWIVRAMTYKTIYRYSFFGALIACGIAIILWFFLTSSWSPELLVRIGYFLSGLFLFLILIPLHEYIHLLAYQYCGADNARIRANWKYFYFYAWAKGFIATKDDIKIIAFSPFIIINASLVILLFIVPDNFKALIFGMLIMHMSGSYGDFAILNYYEHFRDKDIISFDDDGISYFYVKED